MGLRLASLHGIEPPLPRPAIPKCLPSSPTCRDRPVPARMLLAAMANGLVRMGLSAMGSALYSWGGSAANAGPSSGQGESEKLVAGFT